MDELTKAVRDLKNGNPDAFLTLYNLTNKAAQNVIRRYCDSPADYEDILQDTYIRVYQSIGDLKDDTKAQAWIDTIAANTAIRFNMKKKPMMFSEMENDEGQMPDIEDESTEYDPAAVADKNAVTQAVNEVLSMLPEDQRDALWMVYGQKITIREMAASLGLSENTIKSRLYQGRQKLMAHKDEFRKRGIEVTAIPAAVLVSIAFDNSVYAAGTQAAAGTLAASSASMGAAVTNSATVGAAVAKGSAAGAAVADTSAVGAAVASGGAAAAAASGAAAAAAATGLSLAAKIGIAAAVVVIGGGAAVGATVAGSNFGRDHSAAVESVQEDADYTDAASDMLGDAKESVDEIEETESLTEETELPISPVSSDILKKYSCYDGSGELIFYYEYDFDENGRQAGVTLYDGSGNELRHTDIGFDDDGNQLNDIEVSLRSGSNFIVYEYEYEYDEDGRLVKEDVFADGDPDYSILYEYDAEGRIIRENCTDWVYGDYCNVYDYFERDGGGFYERKTLYLPAGTEYSDDSESEVTEYDENDKMIRWYTFNSDGELDFWEEFEYNPDGSRSAVREQYYDDNGDVRDWFSSVYEYDPGGSRSTQTRYNFDGSIRCIFVKEYQ